MIYNVEDMLKIDINVIFYFYQVKFVLVSWAYLGKGFHGKENYSRVCATTDFQICQKMYKNNNLALWRSHFWLNIVII